MIGRSSVCRPHRNGGKSMEGNIKLRLVAVDLVSAKGLVLVLFVSGIALPGCGSSGSGAKEVCTPGATAACICTDGNSGAQSCASDGTQYGACICSPAGTGGAITATGGAVGAGGSAGGASGNGGSLGTGGGATTSTGGVSATGGSAGIPSGTGGNSGTGGTQALCPAAQTCGTACCGTDETCVIQSGVTHCAPSCSTSSECATATPCCSLLEPKNGGAPPAKGGCTNDTGACRCTTGGECSSGSCSPALAGTTPLAVNT